MRLARAWLALPRPERVTVGGAAVLLSVLPLAVRLVRLQTVHRVLASGHGSVSIRACSPQRIVQLVEAVAHHLPWPTSCLHRARATATLLRWSGVDCTITIGIRTGTGFAAHAWITGLTEPADVAYQPLTTVVFHKSVAGR
jgi:hypothetical protein